MLLNTGVASGFSEMSIFSCISTIVGRASFTAFVGSISHMRMSLVLSELCNQFTGLRSFVNSFFICFVSILGTSSSLYRGGGIGTPRFGVSFGRLPAGLGCLLLVKLAAEIITTEGEAGLGGPLDELQDGERFEEVSTADVFMGEFRALNDELLARIPFGGSGIRGMLLAIITRGNSDVYDKFTVQQLRSFVSVPLFC